MRRLFLLLTLVPFSLANEPLNLPENVEMKATVQGYQIETVIDVISVYTGSIDGQENLKSLTENGYACQPALSQLWRCARHLDKPKHELTKIESRLESEVAELGALKTGKLKTAPALTHESSAYTEWVVEQKLTIGGVNYPKYRIRRLNGLDVDKILPGDSGSSRIEFLFDGTTLKQWVEFGISAPSGFTRYGNLVPYQTLHQAKSN